MDKSDVTPGADRNPNLHVNMYGMILEPDRPHLREHGDRTSNQNNDPYTYAPGLEHPARRDRYKRLAG